MMSKKAWLFLTIVGAAALLAVELLALPLPRVVSHTVQAVTASEIQQIVIRRKSDGTLQAVGYFDLKDGGGNVVGSDSVAVDLNGAQTTSIASFATSVLVPAMNAQ
jgi:hypothetical protein